MSVNRSELRPLGGGRVAGRKGRRLPVWLPSFFIHGVAPQTAAAPRGTRGRGRVDVPPLGQRAVGRRGGLLSTDLSPQQQSGDLGLRLWSVSSSS